MAKAPLQTIVKVSQSLELFSPSYPEWSVSDAASALNFPLSSTSILFASLAIQGLLQRTREGRYRLGWRMLKLSQTLLTSIPFVVEAQPVMERLATALGDTIHLATLDADQVIIVARLQGAKAVAIPRAGLGERLPGYGCAVGKVLFAYEPWEKLSPLLRRHGFEALTPNTMTDLDLLGKELVRVRSQGHAYDFEEFQSGISCVAVPIYDHCGHVIAALSVAAESHRFSFYQERYRLSVGEAARELSAALGYLPARNGTHQSRTAYGLYKPAVKAS